MFCRVGIVVSFCFYCLLPHHVLSMDKERKESSECLPPVTMDSFYNVLMSLRSSQFQTVEVNALVLLLSTMLFKQTNPNEPIHVKTTLLHVIVEMGDAYIQLAKTLLEHGAKFDIPNGAGQTAFDSAMRSKNSRQILKLFEQQLRLSLSPAECKMAASSSAHSSASVTSVCAAPSTKSATDCSLLDLRRRFSPLSRPLTILAAHNAPSGGHHRRDLSESALKIPIDQSEVTMELPTQSNINEDDEESEEQTTTTCSLPNMPINLSAAHSVQNQGFCEAHTPLNSANAASEKVQTPTSTQDKDVSVSRSIEISCAEAANPPNSAVSDANDASPRQVHSAPSSHRKNKNHNDSPRTVLGLIQPNLDSRIEQTVELVSRRSPAQEPFTASMVYEHITNAEQNSEPQSSNRNQLTLLPNEVSEGMNTVVSTSDLAHAPSPQISSTNLSTMAQVSISHNATAIPYLDMRRTAPKPVHMDDIRLSGNEHKSPSPAFLPLSPTVRVPVPWYKRWFCCGEHAS